MNNLTRYSKIIIAIVFSAFFLIVVRSNLTALSFDFSEPVLTVTNFLDSLQYNYKGLDIKLKAITVGETYDDNVTFEKEDKLEDFITNAGFGLSMKYEGRTRAVELISNIQSETFAKNKDFNNISEDVVIKFKNDFSKHDRMSLNNVFTHSEAPLFFREDFFEEQFARQAGRFDYFKNRFNIDYTNDIARQLTFTAKYTNHVDVFSGVDLLDSFLNKLGFEVGYLLTSSTIFVFSYDITNRLFEDDRDASINAVAAGLRQYITKKLYFDGRAGVDFIDTFTDENLTKPLIMTSLSYQIDTDLLARLSFVKEYGTNPYTVDIFNNWKTTASLTKQVLERLRCSLSMFYGQGEFIETNFEQTLLGANTTFIYDITKNLKGNITYSYSQGDSNFETSDYTKNTIFLGFAAEF